MTRFQTRLHTVVSAALLAACATGLTGAIAAELSSQEQALIAAVKARSPAALELLERSVRINSGTLNQEGVREVGKLFDTEFKQLGFNTTWREMPAAMNRAGHLIATHEGTTGKRLLLIGHLDTVFEKGSAVQIWQRKGDRVSGQGVNDMKGGDVIIIEALRALRSIGALDQARITVVFTGDEESVGTPIDVARADLIAAAKRSDIALGFEGTVRDQQGRDTGTIGRRASGGWTLNVSGKQGHSMGIFTPKAGYGAVYETARILDAFRQQLIEPDLTFNAALILGGTEATLEEDGTRGKAAGKSNVIANTATVKGDLRYLTAAQGEKARTRMQAIVAQSLPETSAKISFTESYPPMAPTEGNLKVLAQYSQASSDAGLGAIPALPPGQRGAGDVQFVAPFIDSLDGMGATGDGSHSPLEDLEIASIERATIRTALFLYRLTR